MRGLGRELIDGPALDLRDCWGEDLEAETNPTPVSDWACTQQEEFVFSDAFLSAFIGGWGSSKTWGLCERALRMAFENAPIPYLLISPTFRMYRRTLLPTLREVMDKYGLMYIERLSSDDPKMSFPEFGGEIWFETGDRPKHMLGTNVCGVGLDEVSQMTREAFRYAISRARHPAAVRHTIDMSTTPEGFDFVYEALHEREWVGGCTWVQASARDNKFLPPHYVDQLLASLDPVLAKAYIDGEFTPLAQRRVYQAYSRKVHSDGTFGYDAKLPVEIWMDFNVDPMSWVYVQPHGPERWIYREQMLWNSSSLEAGKWIRERAKSGAKKRAAGQPLDPDETGALPIIICDPTGTARQHTTRSSDVEILEELGFDVRMPMRGFTKRDGVNVVNAHFKDATGKVRLYVDAEGCPALVKILEAWSNREGTVDVDERQAIAYGGRDFECSHLGKVLYYGLLAHERTVEIGVA